MLFIILPLISVLFSILTFSFLDQYNVSINTFFFSPTEEILSNTNVHEDTLVISNLSNLNASKAIGLQLTTTAFEFQNILSSNLPSEWISLRYTDSINIDRLPSSDGSGDIIKTLARFPLISTSKVSALFEWESFGRTQNVIDPFYESSQLLWNDVNEENKVRVIRKTTKRPLLFPKREFTLAMGEFNQTTGFEYLDKERLQIPRGTITHAMSSVHFESSKVTTDGYIQAYQDFVAWFIDDKEDGTILLVMTKLNLGKDIPKWAFLTTVALTGIWSMESLKTLTKT